MWVNRTFLTDERTLHIGEKALTLHHENIETYEKNFICCIVANGSFYK